MTPFSELVQQGTAHAWLFIPSAILLGALHGLEPGHSKTMMAAFIIAIRGTVKQAVMLGVAATLSHTLVVWIIALGGMYLWHGMNAATTEPYFQIASAVVIIGVAVWMLWRTWHDNQRAKGHHHHDHEHHHHGDHHHEHNHHHAHEHKDLSALDVAGIEYQDAHELAHADDIRRRFTGQKVTDGQIILFGLTGGLIPCPAAITVLLLCLQLKEITLGAALVLCFSIGLAITLVTVGAVAALSVKHVSQRVSWFSDVARKAPYFSSLLIMAVGLYVGWQGIVSLPVNPTV